LSGGVCHFEFQVWNMAGRAPISDEVQANVLINSRRRCCLCYWLNGDTEVKQGQIAHLDQDHGNPKESKLVFLCLPHHDQYDSKTSQSKGLREQEVRRYRDELYREMNLRAKGAPLLRAELRLVRCVRTIDPPEYDYVALELRLTNSGQGELRFPRVTIDRTDRPWAFDGAPNWPQPHGINPPSTRDEASDVFITDGHVAVIDFPRLLRAQSETFYALRFAKGSRFGGTAQDIKFRIDAEGMEPLHGTINFTHPGPDDALRWVG
jgi:hypothetical protein